MRFAAIAALLFASTVFGQNVGAGFSSYVPPPTDTCSGGSCAAGPGGISTDGGFSAQSSRIGAGGIATDGGMYVTDTGPVRASISPAGAITGTSVTVGAAGITFSDATTQTTAPTSYSSSREMVHYCTAYLTDLSYGNVMVCDGVSRSNGGVTTPSRVTSGTKSLLRYTTPATSGQPAGWGGGAPVYNCSRPALLQISLKTGSSIANSKIFAYSGTGQLFNLSNAWTTGAAFSMSIFVAAFIYDSSVGGNWLLCTGPGGAGANASCVDTGVAVAASTSYFLTLDIGKTTAGTVGGTINGTVVTGKTTNYPLPGGNSSDVCNGAVGVRTTEAVAKSVDIHWWKVSYEMEQ